MNYFSFFAKIGPLSEEARAAGAGKEIDVRLERGKEGARFEKDNNKGHAGGARFLKTHMFLEITQEE